MARFTHFLREPLVHFLVLGAGIFLLAALVGESDQDQPDQIVVSVGQIDRLVETWQRTWQRPPTQVELEGLVEDHIREEILYREAIALGLDRDDTIIRRRLRQKMEFLPQDLVEQIEPTDAELRTYLRENADAYQVLGAGIFLLAALVGESDQDQPDQIVVSVGQIDRLVETWQRTWQRPPTQVELEGLWSTSWSWEQGFFFWRHWSASPTRISPTRLSFLLDRSTVWWKPGREPGRGLPPR